jgi:hypothetical protein
MARRRVRVAGGGAAWGGLARQVDGGERRCVRARADSPCCPARAAVRAARAPHESVWSGSLVSRLPASTHAAALVRTLECFVHRLFLSNWATFIKARWIT